ncbi:MAG: TRAP transporter substrate-binding protein [Candidatus Methylomirabilota bacterium]
MLGRRYLCVVLGVAIYSAVAGFLLPQGEAAGPIVLKLAHAHPATDSLFGPASTRFAESVKGLTNGGVDVQVFHGGSLTADEREMTESVKLGSLDMAVIASPQLTGYSPTVKVFDLPFIFRDHAQAVKVLDGPIGEAVRDDLESKGILILEYWSCGIRSVFTNVKPIRNPDDLKGLKIRVMPTPVYIDTFKALGALPVAMGSSELYLALQMGVVDAGENDPASVIDWKWVEVVKYYSLTQHGFCACPLIMNSKTFHSLPGDVQLAIRKAGRESAAFQRPYAEGLWDRAMKQIEAKGVKINKVESLAAFQEKVKGVYDKYDKELGNGLVRRTLESAQASK